MRLLLFSRGLSGKSSRSPGVPWLLRPSVGLRKGNSDVCRPLADDSAWQWHPTFWGQPGAVSPAPMPSSDAGQWQRGLSTSFSVDTRGMQLSRRMNHVIRRQRAKCEKGMRSRATLESMLDAGGLIAASLCLFNIVGRVRRMDIVIPLALLHALFLKAILGSDSIDMQSVGVRGLRSGC